MAAPSGTGRNATAGAARARGCSADPEAPGPEGVVPRVRVVVVRDVAHVVVDVVASDAEPLVGDRAECGEQPVADLRRRSGGMDAPDHHRHLAQLAVRDPAVLVLVVPPRPPRGLAQLAAVLGRERRYLAYSV